MPVLADDGKEIGKQVVFEGGYVGEIIDYTFDGKPIYRTDFSAPKYLPDLITPIDTQWYDKGGYFNAGDNLLLGYVNGEFVNVQDKQGHSYGWSPDITLSNADKGKGIAEGKIPQGEAKILSVDPLNANYKNNTVEWNLGNGVYRRVRVIEGVIQEYYVITHPIAANFNIDNSGIKDKAFQGLVHNPVAYDADHNYIDLSIVGDKITLAKEKSLDAKVKYPIIIDPDMTFTASANDAWLSTKWSVGNTYNSARTATTGYVLAGDTVATIGNIYIGVIPTYLVDRAVLYFDTSALEGYTITAATLNLYGQSKTNDDTDSIQIQTGGATYPHNPPIEGDYLYSLYSDDGGHATIASLSTGAYNEIDLTATGYGWIDKTGISKFCLRTTKDIAGTTPTGLNTFSFYTYEMGTGYRPKLVVTHTAGTPGIIALSASDVAKTTAKLNASVTDDGGEECEVRFGYGDETQDAVDFDDYDTITDWIDGYETGDSPYYEASSLVADTGYFYRVQIKNSDSTVTSTNEKTFTTENDVGNTTNFNGYPTEDTISLSWVRGTGAGKVMVRYRPDTYPTSETDGLLVYFGTATVFDHENLTSGKTYFYSAWGESGGAYSATEANLAVTTLGASPVDTTEGTAPDYPSGMFQEPDASGLTSLEPIPTIVGLFAGSWGMPEDNMWFGLTFLGIILIGVFILVKFKLGGVWIAWLWSTLASAGASAIGVMPAWIWLTFAVIGIGLWAIQRLRPAGG